MPLLQAGQDIKIQDIVDRFVEYVPNFANSYIFYGTNNPINAAFESSFGGPNTGLPSSIDVQDVANNINIAIKAVDIYTGLLTETRAYTGIRKARLRYSIAGVGLIYDNTDVAYLNDTYKINIPQVAKSGVVAFQTISAANLEQFMANLRTAYEEIRNTVADINLTVCHSSCHSNCHSSRIRR